ncbi:uncharacterized protein LOC143465081 isoform X2 [Clavelina lepadiformis]|uniref:uncharacterized protein LOC143465081 isoform X2 n=1 Tax=Clavelina lepadiformis TaxID=159417 RepID=UPI004042DAE5
MNRCERVSSDQILGLCLLILAWIFVLFALVTPDWSRSVVKYTQEDYDQAYNAFKKYQNGQLVQSKMMSSKCLACQSETSTTTSQQGKFRSQYDATTPAGSSDDKRKQAEINPTKDNKIRSGRANFERWLQVGMRGVWIECAYIPVKPTLETEKATSFDEHKTSTVSMHAAGLPVLSQNAEMGSQFPKETTTKTAVVPVTYVAFATDLGYSNHLLAMIHLNTSKECSNISIERSSCLLLGLQAMLIFSVFCGTLAVLVASVSILADPLIRGRTRNHPFRKRFKRRNIFSVLSGVIASMSGTFVLTGCWWFTLQTNSSYSMPAYQHHHENYRSVFVAGSSLFTASASGIIYLVAGFLLGVGMTTNRRLVCVITIEKENLRYVKHTKC